MNDDDDMVDVGVELDPFLGELVRAGRTEAVYAIGDRVRAAAVPLDGSGPATGIVTGILVTPAGFIYVVSGTGPGDERQHYGFELVADEDGLA